jgi:glutamate racemase
LLKPLLSRVLGPGVALIDSAEEVAAALADALVEQGLEAAPDASPAHRFAVSDDPARFVTVGSRFLGERLGKAELVQLGK